VIGRGNELPANPGVRDGDPPHGRASRAILLLEPTSTYYCLVGSAEEAGLLRELALRTFDNGGIRWSDTARARTELAVRRALTAVLPLGGPAEKDRGERVGSGVPSSRYGGGGGGGGEASSVVGGASGFCHSVAGALGLRGIRPRRIKRNRTTATTAITISRISQPTVTPEPAPSSRFMTDGFGFTEYETCPRAEQ
jgi:hypothetical protein